MSLTLQRSLLPKALPTIEGVEFAARYIPGESGIEVGGDWYSAIAIDDHRFVFVVGDVSGRGLAAATIMAGLRYTIRAYAAIGYSPERILEMGAREINVDTDRHFATVLVGLVDNDRREITLGKRGPSSGACSRTRDAANSSTYQSASRSGSELPSMSRKRCLFAPNSTLIAYTDGLVERRNESSTLVSIGCARRPRSELRRLMTFSRNIADSLLAEHGSDDDTAILAIRWLD